MRHLALIAIIAGSPALADSPFNSLDTNALTGTMTFDVSSLAVAGALVQGTEAGSISAEIDAFNVASALGEMAYEFDFGSEFGMEIGGEFSTSIDGAASAAVSGAGTITTVAGTFGSAQTGFATQFDLGWD